MKFLIKIEEAIDQLILSFIEKMKAMTPDFFFKSIDWFKHTPEMAKHQLHIYLPKARIVLLKFVGYIQHYITWIRGHIISVLIYLKSDEFKKANKVELALAPIKKFKTDPVMAFSVLIVVGIFSYSGAVIFTNAEKISAGIKALRAPAAVEEDPIIEFKKIKYTVLDKEIFLDITIIAASVEERDKLIPIEKEIEEHLEAIHIPALQLPLSHDDMAAIEADIMTKISGAKIKGVEVKQVLDGRPKYFMQTEKMASFKDINLQLFLEDTKRNRQVWVDFTALANNRNIILFLKDHEVEVRDYINMHVEPVIPQLPIEEEGRQIIKEKMKQELNDFLKNNGIEGKILEIYVDYIIVS